MDGVRVSQLWRYPVKSLRGESLDSARLTPEGIEGDRVVHVAGSQWATDRSHPQAATHGACRYRSRRRPVGRRSSVGLRGGG